MTARTHTRKIKEEKRLHGIIAHAILHPAEREQGASYCQREITRRNKARYGKRQIGITIRETDIVIFRDRHIPADNRPDRKLDGEVRPLAYLEHYQASLITSGYVLLDGSPNSLIYQYEGRLH